MKQSYALLLLAVIFMIHMFAFVGIFLNVFSHFSSFSSHISDEPFHVKESNVTTQNAVVKRLIFFVLDAFRTGFVFSHAECLPNIRRHTGLVLNIRTFTPTVTSPRLKTLTTGTVPEFADFFFNMQSSELLSDTLLKRWNESNMAIAFYGDDTWLKLFSSRLFLRHKEVSSFYAVDFTEVDNAVTGPLLNYELKQSDWDVLILHYLGLDHIGHSRGPDGELVCRKLHEMDNIFHQIHEHIIAKDSESMLVVLGDHGMSNEGSHGGATEDELYTPVLFVSQLLKPPFHLSEKENLVEISQVDIATSLAILTGVPIPSASLGLFPQSIFENVPAEKRKEMLRRNYEHLLNLCSDCGPYAQFDNENLGENYKEMNRLQQILLSRHSTVNRVHLCLIVVILALTTGAVMFTGAARWPQHWRFSSTCALTSFILVMIANVVFLFLSSENTNIAFLSFTVIWPIFVPIYLILTLNWETSQIVTYIPLLIFNAAVLFSSSFVEEEHFFWYLATPLLIFIHAYFHFRQCFIKNKVENLEILFDFVVAAVCVRLCKAFVYPGVKWADEDLDYARHFRAASQSLQTQIFLAFNALVFLLLIFWQSVVVPLSWRIFVSFAFLLNFSFIFSFKAIRGDLRWFFWLDSQENESAPDAFQATPYAQASFMTFAIITFCLFVKMDRKTAVKLILPFVFQLGCLLLRCYLVVPLFFLLLIAKSLSTIISFDQTTSNLLIIAISRMAFSALENSNRFATVDVGAAYTGLTTHHAFLSGCLVLLATAFGPLFIFFAVSAENKLNMPDFMAYQCAVFVLCASCVTLQANHLFVWSVFAPKLLYEVFWTVLIFFVSLLIQV